MDDRVVVGRHESESGNDRQMRARDTKMRVAIFAALMRYASGPLIWSCSLSRRGRRAASGPRLQVRTADGRPAGLEFPASCRKEGTAPVSSAGPDVRLGRLAYRTAVRSGPPDPHGIPSAPVPHDTSLDGRVTAKTIDYTLPSVRELLTEFRHQRETGEIRPLATPDLSRRNATEPAYLLRVPDAGRVVRGLARGVRP